MIADVVYGAECVADIWDEFMVLASMHWAETGQAVPGFAGIELKVNRPAYEAMEAAGQYRCFTARINGELVGYSTYLVGPSLYHGLMTANHDVLFVVPQWRQGRIAIGLLKACDEALAGLGVAVVMQESPAEQDCGAIFRRLGYVPAGHTFVRFL
jgi:GNAT superfamily N-acetyltransferase